MRQLAWSFSVAEAVILASFYTAAVILSGVALGRAFGLHLTKPVRLAGFLGLAFALGQGVLGNIWQTMAVFGLLKPALIFAVLIAGVAAGAYDHLRGLGRPMKTSWEEGRDSDRKLLALFALPALMLAVLAGLLAFLALHPPDGDSIAFYMAQAKLVGASGHLQPLAGYEQFAQINLSSEMHFAALYALGGVVVGEYAAKLFVWPNAMFLAVLLCEIGDRLRLGTIGKILLLAALFSSTAFIYLVWDGKTDLLPAVLALAAVLLTLELPRQFRPGALIGIGVLAGMAAAGKLSFFAVLPPLLGTLLIWAALERAREDDDPALAIIAKSSALVALGVVIGLAPMIVKNAALFGEPLAPFVLLKGGSTLVLDQSWYGPEETRWIVATYPLALVFGSYPMQYGNLSVLWLGLLPVLWLVRDDLRRPEQRLLLVATAGALLGLLAWLVAKPSVFAPRYIFPVLLMLLPLAARAGELVCLRERLPILRYGILLAAVTALGVTLYSLRKPIGADHPSPLAVTARYITRPPDQWDHEFWRAAKAINDAAPPGTRVLSANYYTLPLRADLLACLIKPAEQTAGAQRTSAELWEDIYRSGADWLFLYRLSHESAFTAKIDTSQSPPWLEVKEIPIANLTRVYRLTAIGPAPARRSRCVETAPGFYSVEKL